MKKKHLYLFVSIPVALSFWVADSLIHFLGYGEVDFELIPSDVNELWMRSVILVLLVLFGIGADFHTNSLIKKNDEKYAVYRSMLRASHHILNNFLQGSKLFQMEANESKDFDESILKQFDELIADVAAQVRDLEGIHDPTPESIEERY